MTIVSFVVVGEPVGKARPRVTQHGTYTPAKTVAYENAIKAAYLADYGTKELFGYITNSKLLKPITLTVVAYFGIPKSFTKGKRLAAKHNMIRPTKKPDCDNLLKVVADALNGYAYIDDAQIVKMSIIKRWAEQPGMSITICEVQPDGVDQVQ